MERIFSLKKVGLLVVSALCALAVGFGVAPSQAEAMDLYKANTKMYAKSPSAEQKATYNAAKDALKSTKAKSGKITVRTNNKEKEIVVTAKAATSKYLYTLPKAMTKYKSKVRSKHEVSCFLTATDGSAFAVASTSKLSSGAMGITRNVFSAARLGTDKKAKAFTTAWNYRFEGWNAKGTSQKWSAESVDDSSSACPKVTVPKGYSVRLIVS